MMEDGEYHHRDGWLFKRVDRRGTVRIRKPSVGVEILITPEEWVSIIHAVAPEGASHTQARGLHTE